MLSAVRPALEGRTVKGAESRNVHNRSLEKRVLLKNTKAHPLNGQRPLCQPANDTPLSPSSTDVQWRYAHSLAQAALSPVTVLGGALGRQGTVQAVLPSTFPLPSCSSLFRGLASVGAAADEPGFSSAFQTL